MWSDAVAKTPGNGWSASMLGGSTSLNAPRAALLDEVRQSVEMATKELAELSQTVRAFAENTLGPIPETGDPEFGNKLSGGDRGSALRDSLATLHRQISHLRGGVNRLSGI